MLNWMPTLCLVMALKSASTLVMIIVLKGLLVVNVQSQKAVVGVHRHQHVSQQVLRKLAVIGQTNGQTMVNAVQHALWFLHVMDVSKQVDVDGVLNMVNASPEQLPMDFARYHHLLFITKVTKMLNVNILQVELCVMMWI